MDCTMLLTNRKIKIWQRTEHEIFNQILKVDHRCSVRSVRANRDVESQVWVPVRVVTRTVYVPATVAELWVTMFGRSGRGILPSLPQQRTSASEISSAIFCLWERYRCLLFIPLTAPTPSQFVLVSGGKCHNDTTHNFESLRFFFLFLKGNSNLVCNTQHQLNFHQSFQWFLRANLASYRLWLSIGLWCRNTFIIYWWLTK